MKLSEVDAASTTPCEEGDASYLPWSHNFLLPLHMSTILNLLILDIPTYG
jgi:hypothetical protein